MATLVATPKDLLDPAQERPGEDFMDRMRRCEQKLAELTAATEKLPEGEIKGAVITFGVADGGAHYVVVSAKPLKLAHLPYFDAYQIDRATIRGLRFEDVLARVQRSRAFTSIFAKRDRATTA